MRSACVVERGIAVPWLQEQVGEEVSAVGDSTEAKISTELIDT